MITIVKNNTCIKHLKKEKYVFRACPKGIGPIYAKIGLPSLISYRRAVRELRKEKASK